MILRPKICVSFVSYRQNTNKEASLTSEDQKIFLNFVTKCIILIACIRLQKQNQRKMTKITDMNLDCIEHVMKFLNFEDRLSAAESNRTLNQVASTIASRKYSTLVINSGEWHFQRPQGFKKDGNVIKALSFSFALKLLRLFGPMFATIKIDYMYFDTQRRKELEFYLSEYCASCDESKLNRIILEDCFEDTFRWMKVPLKSVKELEISSDSDWDFKNINTKLPNMNSLKLQWIQIIDGTCIQQNFPNLKHFEVNVRERINYFTEDNVKQAILMNPQMESIVVTFFTHAELNEAILIDFIKNQNHLQKVTFFKGNRIIYSLSTMNSL